MATTERPGDYVKKSSTASATAVVSIASIVIGDRHRKQFGNLGALAESIAELGVLHPPVIRAVGDEYHLIAGERRLRAMELLGWTETPATIVTLGDEEALIAEGAENFARDDMCPSDRVAYADDLEPVERERARRRMVAGVPSENLSEGESAEARQRVAAAVGWSFPTLGLARELVYAARDCPEDEAMQELVAEMDDSGNVSGVHKQLVKILHEREAEAAAEAQRLADEAARKMAHVKLGEWWRLGRHRLYCGDTASADFIDNCPQAAFAFADPPYGAQAAEWDQSFVWGHDWLCEKAQVVAVTPGIVSIFDFALLTAMPYRWSLACWIDNGMTRGALGFGNWIYIALFSDGSLHRNAQDFVRVSITSDEIGDTAHKGRKPSGLMASLLQTFTKDGDVVIDPFAGSGSTLIACESLGRSCITGEIDPEFCTEIVMRWQAVTGEAACRED